MPSASGVIDAMRAVAPPGGESLDEATKNQLRSHTQTLLGLKATEAADEAARFLAIADRTLPLPGDRIRDELSGATILVTGGTGCVGSALLAELATVNPGRVVSVSRGMTKGWRYQPGVEYLHADIADRDAIEAVTAVVRPDIVFHVAGQRDPAHAETDICGTVATNILGTRNVLEASAASGVSRAICASTGKAMRLYSPDIYAASKRVAEWVAADIAETTELRCSAARFTHVVDNSIVHQKLRAWMDDPDAVIRLHCHGAAFYAQSALESARLLMLAALDQTRGQLQIHAITDLDWPVGLLDLTLGVLAQTGSRTPVHFSGYDPGYEAVSFPGLYDPMQAGDVSPLINALEAAAITPVHPPTDMFGMPGAPGVAKIIEEFLAVRTRSGLSELSWALLDLTIQNADTPSLVRTATLAERRAAELRPEHRRTLAAIRAHLGGA
jgi:nucleoside-diphosphate-sugar epimerase